MKHIIVFILLACSAIACTDTSLEDIGFTVQELPAYVAYGNPGGTIAAKVLNPNEGSTSTALTVLRIEAPGVINSNVTVNFIFGGNAVFGTDFTVSGLTPSTNLPFSVSATSAGGSITIAKSATKRTVNDFEFVNLKLNYPTDNVKDGNKTLIITLSSAVAADGTNLLVGRGGQDVLKTATVNIRDVN